MKYFRNTLFGSVSVNSIFPFVFYSHFIQNSRTLFKTRIKSKIGREQQNGIFIFNARKMRQTCMNRETIKSVWTVAQNIGYIFCHSSFFKSLNHKEEKQIKVDQ